MIEGIDLYDGLLILGAALLGLALYMEGGSWMLIGYLGGLLALMGLVLAWRSEAD